VATRLPEFENQAEARILFVDSDEQECANHKSSVLNVVKAMFI